MIQRSCFADFNASQFGKKALESSDANQLGLALEGCANAYQAMVACFLLGRLGALRDRGVEATTLLFACPQNRFGCLNSLVCRCSSFFESATSTSLYRNVNGRHALGTMGTLGWFPLLVSPVKLA